MCQEHLFFFSSKHTNNLKSTASVCCCKFNPGPPTWQRYISTMPVLSRALKLARRLCISQWKTLKLYLSLVWNEEKLNQRHHVATELLIFQTLRGGSRKAGGAAGGRWSREAIYPWHPSVHLCVSARRPQGPVLWNKPGPCLTMISS